MTFEPVETRNTQASDSTLNISPDSPAAYLSAGAVREHFADVDRVVFLVDREQSRIAIEPGDGDNSYSITSRDGGASLAVKKALAQLDVDQDVLSERHVCPVFQDDSSGYVVADVSAVVEDATDDVHCEECGKRFASASGMKSHYTRMHDEEWAGNVLKEADPDEVGEPIPEGDDSWQEYDEERGEA